MSSNERKVVGALRRFVNSKRKLKNHSELQGNLDLANKLEK